MSQLTPPLAIALIRIGIALGSCTRGAVVAVKVISPSSVSFSGSTGDDEPFCLSSASIAPIGGPVIWEIMAPLNGSCISEWEFPLGGEGFRFNKRALKLPPGQYYTTVGGSGRYAYVDFNVTGE